MFQCTFSFSIHPSFSLFPLHLFVFERFSCPPHCFFVGALCAIFHCMFCVSLPSRFLRACSPLATRVEQAVLGKEHNLNVFLSSNLALCLNKKGDLRAAVQLQQRVHGYTQCAVKLMTEARRLERSRSLPQGEASSEDMWTAAANYWKQQASKSADDLESYHHGPWVHGDSRRALAARP